MFRIGEFSKLTQVSVRMLRYYDEAGLLKPAEVDRWTGHRLYSVEQIPRLDRIRYLRDSGFLISVDSDPESGSSRKEFSFLLSSKLIPISPKPSLSEDRRQKRCFRRRGFRPPFILLLIKPDRLIQLPEPLFVPLICHPHQVIDLL